MQQQAEIVYTIIIFGIALAGVFFNFKGRVEKTENRITKIEMALEYLVKNVETNVERLNDHDKQQQVMIALVQQVNVLTDDMSELKADVKQLIRRGD